MPYFLVNTTLHYLEPSDDPAKWLPAGYQPITDAQAQAMQFPPPTLAQAQADKLAQLRAACAAAITAGFASSALGAAHDYGSIATDQANIHTAAIIGGSLWCAVSGAWTLTAHTAAQAGQVQADLWAQVQAMQTRLATLSAQVAAATDVAAVEAVVW